MDINRLKSTRPNYLDQTADYECFSAFSVLKLRQNAPKRPFKGFERMKTAQFCIFWSVSAEKRLQKP
jgi:hypothetical protein